MYMCIRAIDDYNRLGVESFAAASIVHSILPYVITMHSILPYGLVVESSVPTTNKNC